MWVEAAAVVFDEKSLLSVLLDCAEFNSGMIVLRSVFPRIPQEIFHHHSEKLRVSVCLRLVWSNEFHCSLWCGTHELLHDRACDFAQVHWLESHCAARDSRKVKQSFDQLCHTLSACTNALGEFSRLLVEPVAVLGQHQIAEPVDRLQGAAKIM